LANLSWDVALIQEARILPGNPILGDIRRARCQIFLSAPDADGTSLLAVIVRSGCVTPLDITSHPRAMSVVWYYGGCYPCRLYNLYGAADGTDLTILATSTVVRDLLIDAEASGRVPSLIAGDFNLEWSQLHCLSSLVASGWSDIGSEPTCAVAATTVPRRIDLLLANAAFHALVTGYTLAWDTGLPTHAAQLVSLIDKPPPSYEAWLPPPPLPDPLRHISKEAAWAKVPAELIVQLRRHMARDDVQSSWGVWVLILEHFFHAQSGEFVNLAARRGSVVMQKDSAKVTPAGDAISSANARSLKRFRRLRELSKCWGAGVLPHRAKLILDALIRAEPRESVWRTRLVAVASKQLIDVLLGEAEAEVVATASLLRQFRRDRWHEWCNDPAQTAKVYRFVRQGAVPVVYPPVTQAVTQPGRATVLASVDELWWKMWRPAAHALNAEPWLQALDRLPRFPDVHTLTGEHLQAIVKKSAQGQGPGPRRLDLR
jgi:hypothetical protein